MALPRILLARICFVMFFVIVLPSCAVSALYVHISTRLWLIALAKRHPDLEFVGRLPDVRSHVDTNRNHGIQHLLLQLKGKPNPNAIKESLLSSVLSSFFTDDAILKWRFPKLRQCLAKHYGFYAWYRETESFDIDNHVKAAFLPVVGVRRVSTSNIQEYVSRAVTKYLPVDIPPWQIELIPCVAENPMQSECHYALVRFHHMLLADCPNLNLGQILQIQRTSSDSSTEDDPLFFTPRPYGAHLTVFFNMLMASVRNLWLQFETKFDSQLPSSGVSAFAAISLICLVNKIKSSHYSDSKIKNDTKVVDLNLQSAGEAIRHTFDPKQLATSSTQIIQWIFGMLCFVVPQFLYREVLCIFRDGLTGYHSESVLIQCALALSGVLVEVWFVITMAATGPLCVLEIMFDRQQFGRNALQNVSVQGRKGVAWSNVDPRQLQGSRSICFRAIGYSLRYLLEELMVKDVDARLPNKCAVAVRTTNWETILQDRTDAFTPFFCVNLPLNKSLADFKVSPNTISHQAASIWLQHHCHMLRLLLPSPAIHVLVNFVSKRFPITVTRIAGEPGVKSAWGIGVVDIVYFATAQCNTGLSITTQQIDGQPRISVIGDTQFNVHLPQIVQIWFDQVYTPGCDN